VRRSRHIRLSPWRSRVSRRKYSSYVGFGSSLMSSRVRDIHRVIHIPTITMASAASHRWHGTCSGWLCAARPWRSDECSSWVLRVATAEAVVSRETVREGGSRPMDRNQVASADAPGQFHAGPRSPPGQQPREVSAQLMEPRRRAVGCTTSSPCRAGPRPPTSRICRGALRWAVDGLRGVPRIPEKRTLG
jgi:hypothetical protein